MRCGGCEYVRHRVIVLRYEVAHEYDIAIQCPAPRQGTHGAMLPGIIPLILVACPATDFSSPQSLSLAPSPVLAKS